MVQNPKTSKLWNLVQLAGIVAILIGTAWFVTVVWFAMEADTPADRQAGFSGSLLPIGLGVAGFIALMAGRIAAWWGRD